LHPGSGPSSKFASAVFGRHGLGSPGFWGASGIPKDESQTDGGAAGLRDALSQLGGIYGAFGRFLGWRADLLNGAFLSQLRRIRFDLPVVPPSAVAATIRRDLGAAAEELAMGLEPTPLWNTLSRTAYRSRFRNLPVIVQVARGSIGEEALRQFEKGVRTLGRPELAGIVAPALLSQFREYIRNGESLVRERSFLDVLSHHRGEILADYPALIPELCTATVLCWPAIEGRPVSELIEQGDSDAPVLIASAILEQLFSLSMVDADLDLDAMIVDRNNRLHFRRLNNPIAVLPGVINTGMKYVSAVLAGNATRSAQTLIRLRAGTENQPVVPGLRGSFRKQLAGVNEDCPFAPSVSRLPASQSACRRILELRCRTGRRAAAGRDRRGYVARGRSGDSHPVRCAVDRGIRHRVGYGVRPGHVRRFPRDESPVGRDARKRHYRRRRL
jgi:hypothetical protein